MFKVYIPQDKLIDLFIGESDAQSHSDWYKILCSQQEIGLDKYEEDVLDMNSPLNIIRRNYANLNFADEGVLMNQIGIDHSKVLANPCGAYLLNVTTDEAKSISDQYGVICESIENLNDSFLTTRDFSVDREKGGKTWERFPFGEKVPSNTLIIQDRFFCNSEYGETINDTFENYEKIIRALLPIHFSGVYHLMVIYDGTKIQKRDNVSFNIIAQQFNFLKEQLEQERGYKILLEVLSVPEHSFKYDKTHNRRIMSNYFLIIALHKLKAFRGTENLAEQSLISKFLYASKFFQTGGIFGDEHPDESEMSHKEWIEEFKKIMEASAFSGQYSEYNKKKWDKVNKQYFPPVVYLYSVNGETKSPPEIKNRLFS